MLLLQVLRVNGVELLNLAHLRQLLLPPAAGTGGDGAPASNGFVSGGFAIPLLLKSLRRPLINPKS